MSLRERLEPFTNLNNLKTLDHETRKQLSMDIRELLRAERWARLGWWGSWALSLASAGLYWWVAHGR